LLLSAFDSVTETYPEPEFGRLLPGFRPDAPWPIDQRPPRRKCHL